VCGDNPPLIPCASIRPSREVLTLDRIGADGRTTNYSTILYLDGEPTAVRRFRMFRNSMVAESGRADRGDRPHVRERGMYAVPLACFSQIERTRSGDYGWSPFRSAPDTGEAIGRMAAALPVRVSERLTCLGRPSNAVNIGV
jgi:hypothetical protein